MTTKKIIKSMLVMTMMAASSVTFAQQGGGQPKTPEERATMQSQWMQQNLSLTSDQATQAYNILLASAKQMEAARTGGGDVRAQMKGINASRDKAMQVVLNADQYQKYQQHAQKLMLERQSHMNNGGNGSAPAAPAGGGQN